MSNQCEGDTCSINSAKKPDGTGAAAVREEDKIVVYSRPICGLCWVCRFTFWKSGLDYEVREIDSPENEAKWGEAIHNNGYTGGSFTLPVVVKGKKAWWSIKDFGELANTLKEGAKH